MTPRLTYLLIFILLACEQAPDSVLEEGAIEDMGQVSNAGDPSIDLLWPVGESSHSKVVKGVDFRFKVISALDFLDRTGQRPSEEDMAQLESESVLIFEIEDTSELKTIFEHPALQRSKDDFIQYLSGAVMNDLKITQYGKEVSPNGVQFEGVMGASSHKTRTLVFISGIDITKEYTIHYNDPLFDAGLIRINHKIKHLPV